RDFHVTGVQTCALPIFRAETPSMLDIAIEQSDRKIRTDVITHEQRSGVLQRVGNEPSGKTGAWNFRVSAIAHRRAHEVHSDTLRSEERRVGTEGRYCSR